jgi:hypothetical protein
MHDSLPAYLLRRFPCFFGSLKLYAHVSHAEISRIR